jgi:Mediator complex subunit 16
MVSRSDAIEKSRLFIKPQEFVSEIGKSRKSSEYGHDIVSKGTLLGRRPTRVCVRCGGKSQKHEISHRGDVPISGSYFSQWYVWERRWWSRCICGGRWVRID